MATRTTATDFGSCQNFVADLQKYRLITQDHLGFIQNSLERMPATMPKTLANQLIEHEILTRYQADRVLEGKANDLVVAHYVLADTLGTGRMGTVYKARSAKDDGWYAIKIIRRRNVAELGSMAEKVKSLKTIRHPRVSALVHIGAMGERVYLVWPYLDDGEKLDAMVARQGQLSPREAVTIAIQVASGLQAYHQRGLFHGLLKPSDILLGSDKRVRIMDFGVGFLLSTERGKSLLDTMTNSKAVARGLDCASPEAILDPLARSPLGDQYSLGCILFYCLAGQFPFADGNPVKKMMGHQVEPPPSLQELNPAVPPRLQAIVERMLAKTPAERYSNTAEVIEELQSYASSREAQSASSIRKNGSPLAPFNGPVPARTRPQQVELPPPDDEVPAEEEAPNTFAWWAKILLISGLIVGAGLGGVLGWFLSR
jgi:serine/threonine-protein kinase